MVADNNRKGVNKRWLRNFKNLSEKYNVPSDVIDWMALDWGLSYDELKSIVLDMLKTISTKTVEVTAEEITKQEIEERQAEVERGYIEEVNRELDKELMKLREENPNIDKHFRIIGEYVRMVSKGYTNSLILTGSGGIGKSYTTQKVLSQELERGEGWELISGFTSPLELYHILYEHRDKVLLFDDCDGILNNEKAIALIKNAMWSVTEKRVISYQTTSDKLKCPSQFIFTGRIIIILNKIENMKDRSIQAMLSRAINKDIDFSYTEIVTILYAIAENMRYKGLSKKERMKVVEYIKGITNESTKEVNIRSLLKAFDIYLYCRDNKSDWKRLIEGLFEVDEDYSEILELMKSGKSISEQIKEFKQRTGLSERTYYRMKRRLVRRIGNLAVGS